MRYFPLFQRVYRQDRIVIFGGGKTALAKAETLLALDIVPEIIAPKILPELALRIQEEGGKIHDKSYDPAQIKSAKLIIAATNNAQVNTAIAKNAKAAHIPVNVVDQPALCDFIFPAFLRRGNLQIAISSSGINPTLVRLIKRRIEQILPWNLEKWMAWLEEKKDKVRQSIGNIQARRLFWEEILHGPLFQEVTENNIMRSDVLLEKALQKSPKQARAALYLVGAGPGHPDLITVRGAQILGQADSILYDRLVSTDVLNRYARRDAEKIPVGKQAGVLGISQKEIGAILKKRLQQQKIVVRLKGGDPGVYAHSAEELEIAHMLNIPCQIIPGITAALGCAASAGIPLTERGGAKGIRFLTLYKEDMHTDHFWQSLSGSFDETLVFYMSYRHRALLVKKLLQAGRKPETPVLLVTQGTTDQHDECETILERLVEETQKRSLRSPVLLIVGDVVRWRKRYGWKQAAQNPSDFFVDIEERKRLYA